MTSTSSSVHSLNYITATHTCPDLHAHPRELSNAISLRNLRRIAIATMQCLLTTDCERKNARNPSRSFTAWNFRLSETVKSCARHEPPEMVLSARERDRSRGPHREREREREREGGWTGTRTGVCRGGSKVARAPIAYEKNCRWFRWG